MNFKAAFCHPYQRDIIELGEISQTNIITAFENIPWKDYLQQMEETKNEGQDIYYSPSFEIINTNTLHKLAISAVGPADNYEFYVFYRRPKTLKFLFGLITYKKDKYTTDIQGQTKTRVIRLLEAFRNNNTSYLADQIGP